MTQPEAEPEHESEPATDSPDPAATEPPTDIATGIDQTERPVQPAIDSPEPIAANDPLVRRATEPTAVPWLEAGTDAVGGAGSGKRIEPEDGPGTVLVSVPGEVGAQGVGARTAAGGGWSTSVRQGRGALEQWSVLALVAALIGALPLTWPVPILSLMAVAFALVGIHNCQLDPGWRNRWMAVLAGAVGLATLSVVIVLTGLNRLKFLPFWTT